MAIIDKPSDYFNTKLYTGTGTFPDSISGVGFSPEFIWIKRRNATASHVLSDIIRGTTKTLYTDSSSAELTNNTYGWVSAFGSDGFSVNQSGSSGENVNASGSTYCAWNWLAGGTASSNTDGSITSNVSANQDAGFSIVSYTGNGTTGATIGHGLGVTPDVIIAKSRVSVDSWGFFHSAFSSQQYMFLNSTAAVATASSVWNALPSSTVFTVGDNASVNDNGNMIAYCFAEKQGYSKFGSYTGNGSTDGTFVYTGFKPAFVIQKNTSVSQGWQLQDNKRLGYNPDNYLLQPHTNQAESALQRVDLLSNGFKVRTTDAGQNASGNNYIYMAFAENPLVSSTGVPACAR